MDYWLYSLIVVLGSVLAGLLLYLITILVYKKSHKSFFPRGIQPEIKGFKGPLRLLFPVVCLMSTHVFLKLPDKASNTFGHVLHLLFILSLSWMVLRIIHVGRDIILSRYDITVKDNLKARRVLTQIRVIERIISIGIILLAVSFMLMSFPRVRQLGVSLLASAGVIGIILGFAAQKTLGNLIAGIQIAISQPIRLDDVVIVENEWGWIEEINLIYVVVRIWDLRRLVVPISYFIENPFQNWTRVSADILGSVVIYADYTIPVEDIRAELTRILHNSPHWDKKVDVLQVTNATDRTIELRALMSAVDSPTAWNLRCEVRERLLEFLQKNLPQCLPKARVEIER
jgi:small-conductance mechanosensitive channel